MELPQADIGPSAIVHVPQLRTVIAGDLAYDGIHQMLALSSPAEWEHWIGSVEAVADMKPTVVVAGHRKPDGENRSGEQVLAETATYIRDFQRLAATSGTPEELIAAMVALYPDRGNLATLWVSAQSALSNPEANQALGAIGTS
jgi:glyoxylase-like metal-dependent hydrolase (beta-lactamase superfamily II)